MFSLFCITVLPWKAPREAKLSFYFVMKNVIISCIMSLLGWTHVNYYCTLKLLRKNVFPNCSKVDGLFIRLKLVCFGNGWKNTFKNHSVRTWQMVHVTSWLCQWFVKGIASGEREVIPWHMGMLTASWNVNWWYLLNCDCLFLARCCSLLHSLLCVPACHLTYVLYIPLLRHSDNCLKPPFSPAKSDF